MAKHKNTSCSIECQFCGKSFSNLQTLDLHTSTDHKNQIQKEMKSMENSKEENLKSVEDFKQENLAPIHGNQNEITYCDICIEKFENSEGLKNHISIVHNGNNEQEKQENLILDHDNILIEECMTRKPIILLNKDKLLDKMAENCEVTISNKIFKKLITKALMGRDLSIGISIIFSLVFFIFSILDNIQYYSIQFKTEFLFHFLMN